MATLTVFTPTYNRIRTLQRTYESMQRQSCKDFVWLIVDDGSTDDTAQVVQEWQNQCNEFEIRYIYKKNGGMHTAHNIAYENIDTELNICIDSDDALAENAVEKILNKWASVRNQGYAGIVGLDADLNTGSVIGTEFPADLQETTLSGFYAAGGKGDKKLVYRTQIIKTVPPYPVFKGEKYVALAYKYLLIDQDYKLAVLNEVLCDVEYQADGSSHNMLRQYLRNPKGFAFWRIVQMQYPASFFELIKTCVHYCSSSMIAKNNRFIQESPRKILTVLTVPLGMLLTLFIKWKTQKRQ